MLAGFHPTVARWFERRFGSPTEPQLRGWPAIQAGRDTLIAAPTGSGKTLAAFLVCLDRLVRDALDGRLADRTEVLYVSPLRALGNDIHRNLEQPLGELRAAFAEEGIELPEIRVAVRTGDSSPAERQAQVRRPPHLLITTPESFYLLLTAERGRALLRTVRTVIVDEIHAVARDKRGAHLALSLERLEALAERRPLRIGLSATQRPVEEIGRFLVGVARVSADGVPDCIIVDEGHRRALDLGLEIPRGELGAVASNELWGDIYDRVVELARQHRTTLVFVNTRRLVERVSHALAQRLGEEALVAHHGSLSLATRLRAEERLRRGEIQVAVATASLELGIDVGAVDLVCQIGSPRSFAVGLQRIGRAGHHRGGTPKGRLFPATRDELVECMAFVRGVRRGRLERTEAPAHPLDVLAQQIVATAACEEIGEEALYQRCRRAWPYRALPRGDFDALLAMLSEGVATQRGRSGAHLHRDGVHRRVKGRRGARLAALTSGGAIPDNASYAVVAEPEGLTVGSLDEDFAIESMAGDIFLLGNTSWRIRRVEAGRVRVEDARGLPPTLPFWNGEAPGRSLDLSEEVAALREELEPRLAEPEAAARWLCEETSAPPAAATQVVAYLGAARAALGALPTQRTLVAERFFDEAGGMQLIVHAPFGMRVNRAFGLALRKRFCRSFDFELQAAATDDGILLSLGPQHSFPLETVFHFLSPETVEDVLTQATLDAPMFKIRWRWNATRALAVLRRQGGQKVPPPIQRMRAEDLLAAVFPAQAACQENVPRPIPIPDHPLVAETLRDCLHEAMDLDGLTALLARIRDGGLRLVARDTPEPSPLSHEILGSHPYSYLDDAPLEERRARQVATRRASTAPRYADVVGGVLDPEVIRAVAEQAWPDARDADEAHDALLTLCLLLEAEAPMAWRAHFAALAARGRALRVPREDGPAWVAAERAALVQAGGEAAELRIVRGWMECLGPTTVTALARRLGLPEPAVEAALARLESEGLVLRGRFSPGEDALEYCERTLLARIHRLTLGRLRREIEPVATADFLRFLLRWQHAQPGTQLAGLDGLRAVLGQLQGLHLPAGAWERDVLPARVAGYEPHLLDQLCLGGEAVWGRLCVPPAGADRSGPVRRASPTRNAPIAIALRADLPWLLDATLDAEARSELGSGARALVELLERRGAMFLADIQAETRRLPSDLEQAMWELVSAGVVTCDGFGGVRALIAPLHRREKWRRTGQRVSSAGGRWTLLRRPASLESTEGTRADSEPEWLEPLARQYLRRYGVVFRDLLARETSCPPWRQLLYFYRRLEARGELRGGRFVAGFAGEQFALPEAVEALRAVRRNGARGERVELCAADPLNLVGILTPGPRVAAVLGQRVVYADGVPSSIEEPVAAEPEDPAEQAAS